MVQIIREHRPESTSEKFGRAFANFGQSAASEIPKFLMQRQEQMAKQAETQRKREAVRNLAGQGIEDLPEDIQKLYVENLLKGRSSEEDFKREKAMKHMGFEHEKEILGLENTNKASKLSGENQAKLNEKIVPLQSGLQTIQRMRQIGKGGNLGRTLTRGIFGGQQAHDRAEYTQLGKSLISLASNIPIRNQKEFETLAHDLYDPSLTDSAREGILDAMERIVSNSMQQFQGGESATSTMMGQKPQTKERPPLSSFHR